jgi:transposase-like protein
VIDVAVLFAIGVSESGKRQIMGTSIVTFRARDPLA